MPIKLKNISATDLTDPLQKHIKNLLSPSKEKLEYAEKRLKAACIATDLIKKNSDTPEKTSKSLDPLQTAEARDNLTVLSVTSNKSAQINQESQQSIHEYLSKQDQLRKENQLIYGKKLGELNLSLGFGLIDTSDELKVPYYKKKLLSTDSFTYQVGQYSNQIGAVEFAITYDNKIFIVSKPEGSIANNLYKMAQGVLLKAVGCIQIDNRQPEESVGWDTCPRVFEGQVKYISIFNAFFDAPKDNIAVSLFSLQQLGIDLTNTQVIIPNDKAPLINHISGCNITICGEMEKSSYYLNASRFPGAKALAEKNLTIFDKIVELFLTIDDEVLLKRNKRLIKDIYGEKELLKLNLIKLFNCNEQLINNTEKKFERIKTESGLDKEDINQPSSSLQANVEQNFQCATNSKEVATGSFNDYWQAIKASIQFFKEKNIDLSFLVSEINIILAYLLQNSLMSEEKEQFKELTVSAKLPGRELDLENIPDYINFYEQDPIKTCMALLKDYSKGNGWRGMMHRFFAGAWNRNYKEPVNKFLSIYKKDELPDNITISGIYEKLKDSGLIFNFDAEGKSSLRKILLFCAKLNNEEEALLNLIVNCSLTSFPPLNQDRQVDCCFGN